jgi:hypothetical protein
MIGFRRSPFVAFCYVLLAQAAWTLDDEGYRIHVKEGVLQRGSRPYRFRAIEAPGLARTGVAPGDIATALNRAAEVGANSICFTACGVSEDGSTVSAEGEDAMRAMAREARGRYMSLICRIFDPQEKGNPAYRGSAVRSVAECLKDEYRLLYMIDGPDSEELVRKFREVAPELTVAAQGGGDVMLVNPPPDSSVEVPWLIMGAVPSGDMKSAGFLLFQEQDPYKIVETMSVHPVETEPWRPDNSVLTESEREAGWIALFNGRDLSGWLITGNRNGFRVQDGIIEWHERGGGMVRTRDRYENFILRLEWKIEKGGNSGIFLRAPRAARASKIGMEFQLRGDFGNKPTDDSTGAIYDVLAPEVNASRPAGEWNEVEILLDGAHLKATLNGQIVHDIDFRDDPELQYRIRKGFIGLQDHGNYVAFRNIRLLRLPPGGK